MKNILTTQLNNTRLYLSLDGLATDRIERAKTFLDLTDATLAAHHANRDEGWRKFGIKWEPEQVLFSEEQECINEWAEFERPKCKSHR